MDFEDIYVSTQSEIVTAPDNEKYLFSGKCNADMIRDYVAVARQFVNDEYADSLERYLNSTIDQAINCCTFCEYYDELIKLQSEQDDTDTRSDELLDVVNDVIAVLKKYDKKFKDKFRLQRLDIMPLMQELHKIVDEYE